jgi:hypothetical protein
MKFCDPRCRHAAWPEAEHLDGSGSCRSFQALYCRLQDRLVPKNAPCQLKEEREADQK